MLNALSGFEFLSIFTTWFFQHQVALLGKQLSHQKLKIHNNVSHTAFNKGHTFDLTKSLSQKFSEKWLILHLPLLGSGPFNSLQPHSSALWLSIRWLVGAQWATAGPAGWWNHAIHVSPVCFLSSFFSEAPMWCGGEELKSLSWSPSVLIETPVDGLAVMNQIHDQWS